MKDFLAKVIDVLGLDHVIVTGTALIAALMASRNDVSAPIPRVLNTLSVFISACIAGYILLEKGWYPWGASGVSYLVGSLGYHLMNAALNLVRQLEIDPLSTAGKIINLVWSWKVPPKP